MVGSTDAPVPSSSKIDPKRLARQALKGLSAATDLLFPRLEGARLLIYHQVDAGNGVEMDLDAGAFERQMRWLADSGRVRSLEEVLANPDSPETSYVITFDDGYRDMYDNGFPLLRELGLPFVLYLTSQPIESGVPLRDDGLSTPVGWDAVGDMLQSGLATLGAHTHTHPDLRLISLDEIEHEVGTSNALIEQRTGARPQHFTYPWGYWSPDADRVIEKAYVSATVAGCSTSRFAPPHAIPRLPIQLSDGWRFFRPRLRGGLRLEDRIRRRLASYTGP